MSARASRHPLSSLAAGLLALVLAVAGIATAPLAAYADETVDATTTEVTQPAAADEEPAAEPADEAAPADAAAVGAPEPEPAVQQGEQAPAAALRASAPEFGITATPSTGVQAGDTVTVRGTMPATIATRAGGELTTQVYLWLCAQPDGSTVGTAGGRASNSGGRTDCAGSPVSIAPVAVPSAGIMTGTGTVTDGVWTFEVPFTIAADAIGDDACTTASAAGRDCAVFTRLNHNFHAGSVADPYQLDQYAVLTFAPETGISVTPATGVQAGDTVTVRGTMPATIATRAGGELTTQVYLWLCAQPDGSTVGTAGGRASNSGGRTDCAGSPVSIAPVAVPSAGIMTGTGTVTDGVWTFEVPFTIAADAIGDDACTTASAAGRDCAVFTRLNHNFHAGSVADPYQLDQYAVLTFGAAASEPVATAVGLSLSKTTGIVPGDRITATATVSPAGAAGTVEILLDGAVIGSGPAGTPLAVASGALAAGAHAFSARFVPADATAFAASSSPELVVEAVSPVPGAGSFTWGGYSEFHQYITGPIARGSITASSGAARSAGGFTWPQTQGGSYDSATGLGTVHYRGALRFTGHNGALDITFANPVIRIDSAASATLLATTNGSQVAFASLDLAAAIRSVEADGSVRYTSVPVRLLAGGAAFYDGRYPVGTLLNPASFVIGSASTAADAPARVVAAAAVENRREPAATPPATEGIEVEGELTEGGEITATASGFQPDEEDILVVIYSEPTVLSRTLQADANGVATWTGRLPAGLTGEHTLTFQGSVNRGAVLDIAALEIGTCTIQDAAFEWGFKESFRAYLDSSIAHGSWTVSDGAEYETPLFRFANGTGSYDAAAQTGRIAFPGAIRFTAHEGVLDTVFSNPTFTFIDAGTAVLALDVDGDTREGDHVTAEGVEFLELDLSAATTAVDGGVVTISGIATTLTEAGNESFGTYPAGEEFDPITITITTADDCAAAIAEPEPTAGAPVDGEEASDASGADLTWMWWLIGAVVLLAAIIAIIVAVRRKKTA